MESALLTAKGITLSIGDFSVSCSVRNDLRQQAFFLPDCIRGFYLPDAFMAFRTSFQRPADLRFIVDSEFAEDSVSRIYQAENFRRCRICRRSDGGLDWTWFRDNGAPGIGMHVLDDWSTLVLRLYSTFSNYLRAECGFAFHYAMLARDACVFHGALLEFEGRGILITARSGTGKTTHARLWRDHENALVLNGDRCLCRRIGGRWFAYGMPWCGNSGEYINRRVPVTCIVQLVRGEKNSVEEVPPFEASMYLLERIFAPVWEPALREKAVDICREIGGSIPVLRLSCLPDPGSVQVLKEAVLGL